MVGSGPVTCSSFVGMELFEEALHRWEQALTFRSRQAEDEACSSVKLGAGDAIAEESVDVRTSAEEQASVRKSLLCCGSHAVACFPSAGLRGLREMLELSLF